MQALIKYCLLIWLFILIGGVDTYYAQPLSGILPKNQSTLVTFNVSYQWNALPNAVNYCVEVANNNTFTSNYTASPLTNQTQWSSFVPTQGTYFWRVKAYTANDSLYSPTYTFSYFTPASLATTSVWLKADAGLTLDANSKVQQWLDLSANGYTMNQPLAAKRPSVVNNAVNGYPSLGFNGSQWLSGGDILDLGFNSRSMFVIGKMAATNQTLIAKSKAMNATFRYGIIKDVASTAFLFQSDNNTSNYSAFNTTNYALYNAFVNRTTAKNHFDVNNTSLGISSFNSNLLFESTYRFLIGAYNNANDDGEVLALNGNICEIIFSDSNDSTEIQKIKGYLKYKYTPVFNLGTDITVSNGFCPQTLTAPAGYSSYVWNTGATTASISATQTGSYWVSAFDAFGFKWTDTIFVQFPTVSPPVSTAICANSTLQWNSGLGAGYTFLWNTGATSNTLNITQAGNYSVTVTGAGGCTYNSGTVAFTIDTYPLTAFLGNDTTLCVGNSVSLQIGAPQTASYLWSNGSTAVDFPITATGTQQISLTSTSTNGCVAQDTITVVVNGSAPTLLYTLPTTICTNSMAAFTNQSTVALPSTITSQVWTFSNGAQLNGNSIQLVFPTTGWISGSIEVSSNNNCASADTFSFYVHAPPVINVNHSGQCSNASVSFSANDQGGSPLQTYAWDFQQGGSISNDSIGVHLYNSSGNQSLVFIGENAAGCADTVAYSFNLFAAPTASFSAANACEGSPISFTNTSIANDTSGIQGYSWEFGDLSTSTINNPQHAYLNEGNYTISLYCLGGNGCLDTSTQQLIIFPIPDLNWVLSPSCKDNPTYFESTSSIPTGSIDSTYWMVNLQYPFNGQTGTYTFTTLGIQYLELGATSNLGCQTDTLILVNVNPSLTSTFLYTPPLCIAGDSLVLTSTALNSTSQIWSINGQASGNENQQSFFIEDSLIGQSIEVWSITTNQFGCMDSTMITIPVNLAQYDLAITQVYIGTQNNQTVIGAEIHNLGTMPIYGAQLTMELTGEPIIEAVIDDTIAPNGSLNYVFENYPSLMGLDQNNVEDFICVRGALVEDKSELTLTNNIACKMLEGGSFSVSQLKPNPSDGDVTICLICVEKTDISIEIFDEFGKRCLFANESYNPGTFMIGFETSQLSKGSYYMRISNSMEVKLLKFVKI